MTTKYNNVRIVAREDCSWCNATGKRRTVSRPGAQPAERMAEESCPRCDGAGHRDTDLLLPGEPFFLVRGKDKLAPLMVGMYYMMYRESQSGPPGGMLLGLAGLRDRIAEWQENNPGVVKLGD